MSGYVTVEWSRHKMSDMSDSEHTNLMSSGSRGKDKKSPDWSRYGLSTEQQQASKSSPIPPTSNPHDDAGGFDEGRQNELFREDQVCSPAWHLSMVTWPCSAPQALYSLKLNTVCKTKAINPSINLSPHNIWSAPFMPQSFGVTVLAVLNLYLHCVKTTKKYSLNVMLHRLVISI